MLKSRYGHAQPKVGHGQEFGCDFRTKGSCGGRTQFVLDLTCSKTQRMRKDVAVVALRHIFFGRTPASTRAQRDESLTAGAKRCICINTGRECCHQPWAGCERTCSAKSEKTAWTFETSGTTRPATQRPKPRRRESSAAVLWEPQTSNWPQFCLKVVVTED